MNINKNAYKVYKVDNADICVNKNPIKVFVENGGGGGGSDIETYYVAPSDEVVSAFTSGSADPVMDEAPKFFDADGSEVSGSVIADKIKNGNATLKVKKNVQGIDIIIGCGDYIYSGLPGSFELISFQKFGVFGSNAHVVLSVSCEIAGGQIKWVCGSSLVA